MTDTHAHTYKLTLGSQSDLVLNRLAAQHNTTCADILVRAINTYATLSKYPAVYVQLPANDNSTPPDATGLRRIALP